MKKINNLQIYSITEGWINKKNSLITESQRKKVLDDLVADHELLGARKSSKAYDNASIDNYALSLPILEVELSIITKKGEGKRPEYNLKITDTINKTTYVGSEKGLNSVEYKDGEIKFVSKKDDGWLHEQKLLYDMSIICLKYQVSLAKSKFSMDYVRLIVERHNPPSNVNYHGSRCGSTAWRLATS